jgi:hypothetical protein
MDTFLYENVNDSQIRIKIMNSGGFCNTHAYNLLEKGDALAHSLIYSQLLLLVTEDNNKKSDKCLFCSLIDEVEKIYADNFLNYYENELFKQKYRKSGMLCLNHFNMVISAKNHLTDILKKDTYDKYKIIINDLNEIKRKNDYRFSAENWTENERIACKKAVSIINGYKGMKEKIRL